jgi:Na+-driven multidrug efflux pump
LVLQNVYNPLLARHLALGERDELVAVVRRGRVRTWIGMAAVGALAVALYPLALRLLAVRPEFLASHLPFAILIAGIVAAAGYLPFGQLLLMGGRPGTHTLLMTLTVLTNVVGNSILIPTHGLAGAAAATAVSMAVSIVLLRVLVRARLGLRI